MCEDVHVQLALVSVLLVARRTREAIRLLRIAFLQYFSIHSVWTLYFQVKKNLLSGQSGRTLEAI